MDKQDITICVDSRENLPYTFSHPTEVIGLKVGDYSIKGLEDQVAVERKELNDLIGCLTTGRERFERELAKSRGLAYFALVIEAAASDIITHKYRSRMKPKSAIQSLMAFSIRYHLPIFFCENRSYAQRMTESLLEKYSRELEKKADISKQE